jgi:hypothetical protein
LSDSKPNPAVLSRLYLSAVLPCLTDLVDQEAQARTLIGTLNASIQLRVVGGSSAVLRFDRGRIEWQPMASQWPLVILLFFGDAHVNAFFSGKKWALPFPAWGAWRITLLARFSKLAQKLEAVLSGDPEVLATETGRRAHTRLTLIAAGLGLHSLAKGDEASMATLSSIPKGLAAFIIQDEPKSTVWFDHGSADQTAGWSEPPRTPDVRIVFRTLTVAYAAMRDDIDSMAAVGKGDIRVEGLIPLADGLNFVMERLRVYLKP